MKELTSVSEENDLLLNKIRENYFQAVNIPVHTALFWVQNIFLG